MVNNFETPSRLLCPDCTPEAPLGTPRQMSGEKWHAPCYRCGVSHLLKVTGSAAEPFVVDVKHYHDVAKNYAQKARILLGSGSLRNAPHPTGVAARRGRLDRVALHAIHASSDMGILEQNDSAAEYCKRRTDRASIALTR